MTVKPKIRNTVKPKRKKSHGARNRRAGHTYERQIAKEVREYLGDDNCRTSRQASRLLDDCKVDVTYYGANIQTKNVRSNINYVALINSIREEVSRNFPSRSDLPIAVFHKKSGKEFVVMDKSDFYRVFSVYQRSIETPVTL